MNAKKSLLVAGVVSSIALTGVAGASIVSAATDTSNTDSRTGLVDKIAAKFNLNKDEVKAVFEADRAERQAEHQAKFEERLTQAVKDGKLTEDQKSKILAKVQELKADMEANREAMKDMTAEERKAHKETMEAKRAELEKWASDNNIPKEYLHFGMIKHGHGHGGPRGEFKEVPSSTQQ